MNGVDNFSGRSFDLVKISYLIRLVNLCGKCRVFVTSLY